VVMNFISGYSLYCAYPSLTLNHKGHVNPKFVREDAIIYPSIQKCVAKYEGRGFSILRTFSVPVACGFNNKCSHTIRSIYDGYSLFIPFDQSVGHIEDDEPINCKYVCDKRYDTIWCLGGRPCYGTREGRQTPFVGIKRLGAL
jgi:hypothetical protein